jgi:hypothetical protein
MPKTNGNLPIASKIRLEKLKMMKAGNHKQTSKSTSILLPKKEGKLFPAPTNLTSANITHASVSYSKGPQPKLIMANEIEKSRPKTVFLSLKPFMVRYSQLGENGNLNSGSGQYAVTDPKKARFVLVLQKGIPDECSYELKNGENDQQADIDKLRQLGTEGLQHAFNDDEIWPQLCKDVEEDDFMANTNLAYLKKRQKSDEDETEIDIIELKRKLTDYNGGDNRPQFWRYNDEGILEVFDLKHLPSGSLVIPSVNIRYWGFVDEDGVKKVGASGDLGSDILVVWKPSKSVQNGVSTLDDVPQFDF